MRRLENCVSELQNWMSTLKLNSDKTDFYYLTMGFRNPPPLFNWKWVNMPLIHRQLFATLEYASKCFVLRITHTKSPFNHDYPPWGEALERQEGVSGLSMDAQKSMHLITYFSGMKIDPKYAFLQAFFLICPSCPFQNLSIWRKTHPFFQFCTFLYP